MNLRVLAKVLSRKKRVDLSEGSSKLERCLTTLDLTALGIGSTLGLGIYVIAGQVASTTAGPSVVLSFFFAAVASVFAGFCYAEFGARVPKAGSAYVYSYITIGELTAFVIGWNLILEYVIGTASVARGYSGYIDSLTNGTIERHFRSWLPMNVEGFAEYPDFLAFGLTVMLTIMLALGVKESTRFNTFFTCLNLIVVICVIIAGAFKAKIQNWTLAEKDVPRSAGKGGFMPWGFSGMMEGAATCFYAFIGFDVIATTGEEVKNPKKSIPISIVISLLFIFLAYFGVSAVQTMMWPYYDQDRSAPLPYVFEMVGWPVARWFISIGALAGLSTSLLGAMFPLPRVLYAMGSDGLIFRSFANVHPRFKTPLLATFVSGLFSGGMSAIFNVKELADMMSIGTLLAYSLVALSVMILRFTIEEDGGNIQLNSVVNSSPSKRLIHDPEDQPNEVSRTEPTEKPTGLFLRVLRSLNVVHPAHDGGIPAKVTSRISTFLICATCIMIFFLDLMLVIFENELFVGNWKILTLVLVLTAFVVFLMVLLSFRPRSNTPLSFRVPWVPLLPLLSVTINIYLMLKLSVMTWIRFGVWMGVGMAIYVFYGISHSSEAGKMAVVSRVDSEDKVSPKI